MAEETYHGSCQCGAIAFSVALDLSQTVVCNCSRCRRLGAILTFAPRAAFSFESGEDATTEYLFNKHVISHRFCPTCGIQTFGFGQLPDGTPTVAVNVNCLDGVDPLQVRRTATVYDGASS